MKKTIVWVCAVVLVCSVFQGVLYAKNGGKKFKHADRNKDGVISPKEFHKEKKWEEKERKERKIKKVEKANKKLNWWEKRADTDGDGIVDKKERSAWKKLQKERIDMDGDGVISPKERRLCWRHARSRVNTNLEKKYDANKDGWLESAEVREMLNAKQALIKSKGKAKVDSTIEEEYDINKDGTLDKKEAKVLRKDLKEKLPKHIDSEE